MASDIRYLIRRVKTGLINANEAINKSAFGRIFRLRGCGHPEEVRHANFATEVRAGLTTFATMAYIISVNAHILTATSGPCLCTLDNELNCTNPDYNVCIHAFHRELIMCTAAIAGIASLVFGFVTNLPVALAPGMGLNAYFAYQVVGVKGTGPVPYRIALTAVFVEGFIFLFLALTGMRQWLIKIIPGTLKTASGVGIGMFLALSGLSFSSGIGIITSGGVETPLAIGGCPEFDVDPYTGSCMFSYMQSPRMWLGVASGILTAVLMAFRVKAAIIIGIAFATIISWPRNTEVTYFPTTHEGKERWEFFKQIVAFRPWTHTLAQQEWDLTGVNGAQFAIALFTFLYVDIVDCTATLYSMARFSGKTGPDGDFPRSTLAYCTDAIFISIGSLFGCSPSTAFIESGAGIAEGGRTGLTAVVTGLCFIVSIFFAPIFASIPPWATGTTLVLVGCLMIRQVTFINWNYIGDAIPSFITVVFMPFSYSVAYGLIAGLFVYVTLNSLIWIVIKATRGAVEPREYDLKEYWTWRPAGRKSALLGLMARKPRRGGRNGDNDEEYQFRGEETAESLHNLRPTASTSSDKGLSSSTYPATPSKVRVANHPQQ